MKKSVIIEDKTGAITTGWTFDEIEVGQYAEIECFDENGMTFTAFGKVVEFDEC